MKIYTKTGDTGKTSLFGGRRVSKDDIRVEACGTVDELNSAVGLCRAMNTVKEVDEDLEKIQNDLFTLGAELATPSSAEKKSVRPIGPEDVQRLETRIDEIAGKLPPLSEFILPGGNRTAAQLHLARSICRRAERRVVTLHHTDPVGSSVTVYLNRLSDFLFTMARWVNLLGDTSETTWNKGT